MQATNPMDGNDNGGGGQIMANIAESMFSQHYQSDGLMMASSSSSAAVAGAGAAASAVGGGGMDAHPHQVGRGRIFSIDLDRE